MVQIPPEKLKAALVEQGLVNARQFDEALEEATRMNQDVADVLVARGIVNYDYLYNLYSAYLDVERANLDTVGINKDVLLKIDERFARERGVVAFSQDASGTINVAMQDPADLSTVEFLEKKLSANIKPFLASPEDLAKGFSMYGLKLTEDFKQIIEENVKASLQSKIGGEAEEKAASSISIVDTVNNLFLYAISLSASDIHWEILEDDILVRFRVDGILYEIIRIPKEIHPAIVARIKLLSALKIDEHQKPQDGRFRFRSGSTVVDVRTSVIPTLYGEKIVLRLLPATQRPLSLSELGMLEETVKLVEENIKKAYGMILVTGPTGSGKTTDALLHSQPA